MQISVTTINVIQAMLAPGLMISACGLLILGMNNKYSMVVGRIRLLNEERRRIKASQTVDDLQRARLESIAVQLAELLHRLRLVRDAVVGYSTAVGLFILSSFAIGLRIMTGSSWPEKLGLAFFVTGMMAVLGGILFAASEAVLGYRIVQLEAGEVKKSPRENGKP